MAEDTLKNIFIGLVLVSLFGMLILTSVVEVGNSYSKNTSEIVGGSLSLSKFNQSITNVSSSAQTIKKQFEKGSIWDVGGVVVTGFFSITKTIFTMLFYPFSIISDILSNVFEVPIFVTSTILGLFIFAVIFAIWRLIKIGD